MSYIILGIPFIMALAFGAISTYLAWVTQESEQTTPFMRRIMAYGRVFPWVLTGASVFILVRVLMEMGGRPWIVLVR